MCSNKSGQAFFPAFVLLIATISSQAQARSTNVCFSREEARNMLLKREVFSKEASSCLKQYWSSHAQFYNQNKYSKYFGVRNKAIDTDDKRQLVILNVLWPNLLSSKEQKMFQEEYFKDKKMDKDGELIMPGLKHLEAWMEKNSRRVFQEYLERKPSLKLVERAAEERGAKGERGSDQKPNNNLSLQNISCIDMTRRCLRSAFTKIGMLATFKKIDAEILANGVSGVVLQKALVDLGWKSYYWNPDTRQNDAWDEEDKKIFPLTPATLTKKAVVWQGAWGGHAMRWSRNCNPDGTKKNPAKIGGVLCSNEYGLGNEKPLPVDDKELLVNFGESPPEIFASVPFFVGSGHSGYHIFPGFHGQIIEAHSMRSLRAKDNLEVSTFNPLAQKKRGGPRWTKTEKYRSGVIVIPPGYLETKPIRMHAPQMDGDCVDLKPSRK